MPLFWGVGFKRDPRAVRSQQGMPQGFAARPQLPPDPTQHKAQHVSRSPALPPGYQTLLVSTNRSKKMRLEKRDPEKSRAPPLPRRGWLQPPLLPPARLRLPTAPLRAQRGFDLLLGKRDQRCEKKKKRKKGGKKKTTKPAAPTARQIAASVSPAELGGSWKIQRGGYRVAREHPRVWGGIWDLLPRWRAAVLGLCPKFRCLVQILPSLAPAGRGKQAEVAPRGVGGSPGS